MSQANPLELSSYKMPAVKAGMIVRWFPSGTRTARNPDIAQVKKVSERSVVLVLSYGQQIDTVRHVDDPKLTLNADQRETGAWDYTEEHYQRAAWESHVDKKIEFLERALRDGKPKKSAGKGISGYHDLRKRAQAAGVKFSGNPPKAWLEEQLGEMSDEAGASTGSSLPDMAEQDRAGEEG